jgi:hypothetical protein
MFCRLYLGTCITKVVSFMVMMMMMTTIDVSSCIRYLYWLVHT